MSDEIRFGTIVKPLSGWPPMAVVEIDGEAGEAVCIWKDEHSPRRGRFPLSELRAYMQALGGDEGERG